MPAPQDVGTFTLLSHDRSRPRQEPDGFWRRKQRQACDGQSCRSFRRIGAPLEAISAHDARNRPVLSSDRASRISLWQAGARPRLSVTGTPARTRSAMERHYTIQWRPAIDVGEGHGLRRAAVQPAPTCSVHQGNRHPVPLPGRVEPLSAAADLLGRRMYPLETRRHAFVLRVSRRKSAR